MPKLLLADDSVTIRKVVELTFAEEGVEVISTGDGDSAMEKFHEERPDIVLADVEMPGKNGYEICEAIKTNEATFHIPVVLLVGSFEPFDQTEAERVGADGFLTKPFHSIRDLVARVNELLKTETELESVPVGPETDDIEHLYEKSFNETQPLNDADTDEDPFSDASLDDEMVETVQPAASYMESDDVSSQETIQSTIGSIVLDEAPTVASSYDHLDPDIHDSKADTEEIKSPFMDIAAEQPAGAETNGSVDLSDETITLIAKRVVEKLSDRVVREIAQEAVPRITEKLIREALEEEKKT